MSTLNPTVSLYVPCLNGERHIQQTLESVLSQTHPISQIVVVDDGSTDQTSEIVKSFAIEVVRHPKTMGITKTRNTALEHSRGEFVACVDSDVILENDWLEKIMGNFTARVVGGVGGRIIETNRDSIVGQWIMAHRSPDGGTERKNPPSLPAGAAVYRRNALMEIGGYNDDKRYDHSDLDASMRVVQIGYVLAYEPEAVCYHHFSGTIRSLFDGLWRFKRDAFVNCGLFTNTLGLRRKIKINLSEFHQMLMDDYHAERFESMYLNIIGALRHSLLDIGLFDELHPGTDRRVSSETLEAIKTGIQYLFSQKEDISQELSREILSHVQDICVNRDGYENRSGLPAETSEEELRSFIQAQWPLADLNRVSDRLVMVLGFLNSLPAEVWEPMNQAVRNARPGAVGREGFRTAAHGIEEDV